MNEDVRILFEKQLMSNVHEITIRKPHIKFYETLVVRLLEAMDVELQYTLRVIPRS